jgi:tetratricopeptide (TPR) repeat protein
MLLLALSITLCTIAQSKHRTYKSQKGSKNYNLLVSADDEFKQEHFGEALVLINDFLTKDTTVYYAYYLRGKIQWFIKGTDQVLADFSHSLRLNPSFSYGYYERANWEEANDHLAALNDYTMAIKYCRDGNLYKYYAHRASTRCDMLDWGGAIDDGNKSIQLNSSDNYTAYESLAHAYFENQEYQTAIKDCDKAISILPTGMYFPFYIRGISKAKIGNKDGACEDLNRAFEIEKNDYKLKEAIKTYCEN